MFPCKLRMIFLCMSAFKSYLISILDEDSGGFSFHTASTVFAIDLLFNFYVLFNVSVVSHRLLSSYTSILLLMFNLLLSVPFFPQFLLL